MSGVESRRCESGVFFEEGFVDGKRIFGDSWISNITSSLRFAFHRSLDLTPAIQTKENPPTSLLGLRRNRHRRGSCDNSTKDLLCPLPPAMFGILKFQTFLMVVLLFICSCTYIHGVFPAWLDRNKSGPLGTFWRAARIGERLSPYVSVCCMAMAVSLLVGG
nr:protein kish-a [Quercus suber]